MSNRKTALRRVKTAKELGSNVKNWNFVQNEKGSVHAVFCPCCGKKIKGLVPLDSMEEKRVLRDRTVIVQRVILQALGDYAEVTIEMDDGSAHVMPICGCCLDHGLDEDCMEQMYSADLGLMAEQEAVGMGDAPWSLLAARKPISFKRAR